MRKQAEIELEGATVRIIERSPAGETWRSYNAKPRMYVGVDKEFSVLEDMANRFRRPFTAWRKVVKDRLVDTQFNLERMPWSQTAGCGCGCSPGFVLEHQSIEIDGESFRRFDVWVT
jgi:hypothetical protein